MADYGGKTGEKKIIAKRKPLRFAVIEMGSYADAKVFAQQIHRECRNNKGEEDSIEKGKAIDVSPDIGRGRTFAGWYAKHWPKYKEAIEKPEYSNSKDKTKEPDWWYISGHHANHDWPDNKYYAKNNDVGFFNGAYHHHRGYSNVLKIIPNAIFLTTSVEDNSAFKATTAGKDLLDIQVKPNPLYKSGKNDKCKGLFLIGCNSLSFLSERLMFQKLFPSAVIFGYFESKAPGAPWKHVRAIFKSIKRNVPSFFEDPEKYMKDIEPLEAIVGRLGKKVRWCRIAAYYKKTLYIPKYNWRKKKNWTAADVAGESDFDSAKEKLVLCPVPGK
jgi:hypothetical protein